ncbi:Oligouridylate-binding protein 1 [Vitis vinifera]|uniref:Oligouridylate-binding protein 1 n=1 Tax=Vitis vinifera TaxID=29760 RepID=A0A438J8T1_VITVI|nr:Oligouridylate-binding protein 1 [Vitis vinifera]
MQQQRLKQQQQALIQQSLLQQQSLYHTLVSWLLLRIFFLLSIFSHFILQIEPILSGNLPPGFDSSTCRSVYVGNIHPQVTEPLLQEVFSSTGPSKGASSLGKRSHPMVFVDYFDRRSAALSIVTLNGRHLFGQPIKVNWAYASSQREDTSGHYNIFVGDLSPEVTDATLFACFSVYPSCSDARVMWIRKLGVQGVLGLFLPEPAGNEMALLDFVLFLFIFPHSCYDSVILSCFQEAQSAINDLNGRWLGSRQIRCNWATKGAGGNEDKPNSDAKSVVELTNGTSEFIFFLHLTIGMVLIFLSAVMDHDTALNQFTLYAKLAGSAFDMDVRVWSFTLQHCYHRPYNHSTLSCAEDGKDKSNDEAPENNLQYTTVYVGNLAPEARIFSLTRSHDNITKNSLKRGVKWVVYHCPNGAKQQLKANLVVPPDGTKTHSKKKTLILISCVAWRAIIPSKPSCSIRKLSCDAMDGEISFFSLQVVTSVDLHRHFHALGAGAIEDVRVQRDKGFGFVRYSTHAEAALAIQMGNARILCGKPIKKCPKTLALYFPKLKLSVQLSAWWMLCDCVNNCLTGLCVYVLQCSWGSKPTPAGTSSTPLPPPAAPHMPGISAADFAAYERQMALSKMGGAQGLMHPQAQHALKQTAMGMGAGGSSQAIYDGGFQNAATTQQLMYYQ